MKKKIFVILILFFFLTITLWGFNFSNLYGYKWRLLYKGQQWQSCCILTFGNDGFLYNQVQTQKIGEWGTVGTDEIYFKLFAKCEGLNGFIFLSPGAAMEGYAHIGMKPVKIFLCQENAIK